MRYKLHIPYGGSVEPMLREAVESVREIGNIHIWSDGVPAPDIEGVTHHELPPNGAAATINMALQSSWDDDVALLMHADALAYNDGARRFLDFTRATFERGERWGVIFTLYDVLMAFNMKAVHEVGYWDTRLYQYGADDDYYYRLKLAGWNIVESGDNTAVERIPDPYLPYAERNDSVGVIHRGSATARSNPLFKHISDGRNHGNSLYYIFKWGGLPHEEKFTRAFEDFYTK